MTLRTRPTLFIATFPDGTKITRSSGRVYKAAWRAHPRGLAGREPGGQSGFAKTLQHAHAAATRFSRAGWTVEVTTQIEERAK